MNLQSLGLRVIMTCCLSTATFACARASREPDQAPAAASVERFESQQEPALAASPAPVQPSAPAPVLDEEVRKPQPALAPAPPKPAAQRARGAPSPAREAKAADKKGSTPNVASEVAQGPVAEPALAYSESPDLIAAVVEFDKQWEALSGSRACDDACRAFDSMRRSAKRICELVVADDPRQRCRTAQARLDQASRDLATRCSECR